MAPAVAVLRGIISQMSFKKHELKIQSKPGTLFEGIAGIAIAV
jgi:hypothetical protein